MAHPEALLFVDDQQSKVVEDHVFGQQPVGTDGNVHLAGGHAADDLLLLPRRSEARKHLHLHREWRKPPPKGFVMLERQYGSRCEESYLLAVGQRLEGSSHGHLGLAKAHVAADQSVHGQGRFHVLLDVPDGVQLIRGLLELKSVFELALPVAVGGEGKTGFELALGVEFQEFVGHIDQPGSDSGLGAAPGLSAHAVQRRSGASRPVVPLHQVQPCQGDVQPRPIGVFDEHEIFLARTVFDLFLSQVPPDAVFVVDDKITGLKIL